MKHFRVIILAIFTFSISCTKSETETSPTPDPTAVIVDKWWCGKAGASTISAQYFKSDGTWEQGAKGGKFNDTGKWALSSNKKTIVISSVLDYNKKSKSGWEYAIESSTSTNLLMTWSAFNVKMDMEVCK